MDNQHTLPASAEMKRSVRLQLPLDAAAQQRLRETLENLAGVVALEIGSAGERLQITYDVAHLDFQTLLAQITAAGVVPARGRWQRFRHGLYQFMDENARSNLTARAACCSKPPPGYRPRR